MFGYIQAIFVQFLLSCSSCFSLTHSYQTYICIDGVQGNDSTACLLSGCQFPCKTLNYAFQTSLFQKDVMYKLSVGIHYLNTSVEFNSRQNIAIVGGGTSHNDTNIVCTNTEGGLKFNRSYFLLFEHFSITNCSFDTGVSQVNSNWYSNRAALLFYECHIFPANTTITINDVRISYSRNATALVLLDTNSLIAVTNSVFDQNGRGVNVHMSNSFKLWQNIQYNFMNCSIKNNSVLTKQHDKSNRVSCIPLNKVGHTYSYGGGMSVTLQNNGTLFGINLQIFNTQFLGNKARCGGGLFMVIQHNSVNNIIQLRGCLFENNACPYLHSNKSASFGGGLRLEHLNSDSTSGQNIISVQDCLFKNNSAFSGGGLSICPLAHTDTLLDFLKIQIENTQFVINTGNVGAAVQVSLIAIRVQTKPPNFLISNSTFFNNSILVKNHSAYQIGVGTVYTNQVPIKFHGRLLFLGNHGTALAAAGTYLLFNDCNAEFTNNSGLKGGAISLLGAADMVASDFTKMTFTHNHAKIYGGAIYVVYIEQENLIDYFNCFARPTKPFKHLHQWTANFVFIDNSAEMSGSSIFTTSSDPCEVNSGNILCSARWNYFQKGRAVHCKKEISTEPGYVQRMDSTTIKTIPGKIASLNLSILDDFQHELNKQTVFAAHIQYADTTNISINDEFRYVADQKIVINGVSGSRSHLHLHTIGNRAWHLHIPVELLDCPPGFILKFHKRKSASHCKCYKNHTYRGALECDPEEFESYLSSGYWMGYRTESENNTQQDLVVSSCPPGFCEYDEGYNTQKKIRVTDRASRNKLCLNREGVLCGKCIDGYGPAVNCDSYSCVVCQEESIGKKIAIYVFTVYAPLLILFSLMIFFGVRLTTGHFNAFIFYSQVMSSTFDIDADGRVNLKTFSRAHHKVLQRAYKVPYGLFNLEFVENFLDPFCISTHLNALDVIQLDYLVALTPLAMIVIVLVCFKLSHCCNRVAPTQVTNKAKSFWAKHKCGEHLLDAFAAFVLLSYTKFGLTSAYIIKSSCVYNATGDVVKPDLVQFAGQYNMADSVYLVRYFFPACLVLIINALPPLFLLGYPVIWLEKCLMRFQRLWKYYPVDKVHILLDTFQSCFKDNRRFFAGLYFMFRYAINIVYIVAADWYEKFMVQQIVCTVLVLLIAIGWPYKKNYLNYIDLLTFGNLAIINALSFYVYYRLHNESQIAYTSEPRYSFALQYVLVFLPLFYVIVYCAWRLIGEKRRRKLKRFFNNLKNAIQRKDLLDDSDVDNSVGQLDLSVSTGRVRDHGNRVRNPPTTSEVIVESSEYENAENGDETLIVRSRARNTYRARRDPQGLLNSHSSMGKDPDSGISSSQAHHTDSQPRPSPLVPILSVEEGTKNYGATD